MNYMVEVAIEREAEILDAFLELPEMFEPGVIGGSWDGSNPQTRQFRVRTSDRRTTARPPRYDSIPQLDLDTPVLRAFERPPAMATGISPRLLPCG
jgi:hypothetical protein